MLPFELAETDVHRAHLEDVVVPACVNIHAFMFHDNVLTRMHVTTIEFLAKNTQSKYTLFARIT